MKQIKGLFLALFMASPAMAAVHVAQYDAVTFSSVTLTGTGIKFSDSSVQTTAASGSGGSASIAVSSGSATNSVVISSPTTNIVVDSNTFVGSLQGSSTAFLRLNPSSVTLQGIITASNLGAVTSVTGTNGATANGSSAISVSVSSVSLSTQVIGNLPVGNLNSGTNADSSHFWRGDATWVSSGSFLTGNQTITLSGDASGSGATSISVTNAPWQPNIKTFTSSTTLNGTVVISSGLVASGSAGTNGQVLTSGGVGTIPTWTSSSGSKAALSYNLDGGGIVISSAVASLQRWTVLPYAVTISSSNVSCSTNTATISVSVSTTSWTTFKASGPSAAGSICAAACPSLASGAYGASAPLTGWVTSLNASEVVVWDITVSAPTVATVCKFDLWVN